MSKRSFRIAAIVVASTVLVVAIAATLVVRAALSYPDKRRDGEGVAINVTIDRGMGFPRIAERLQYQGVIERPLWFRLYAMHRGVTTEVRAGDYQLRDDMTPREVLDKLLAGVVEVLTEVTVPEGINMLETFDLIEKAGIAKATELVALARDPDFLEKHAIEGDSLEGYLFPETYKFPTTASARLVLETMIDQFRAVWRTVSQQHAKALAETKRKLRWTDRDILIMASIVEKEAQAAAEQPRIAQVFINRLLSPTFIPHRLDTDPTIRYGCQVPVVKSAACKAWDPTQRLRSAQLHDKDNPYNTYEHEGLPPGPIASPGRGALAATVEPDGSGFFFFVARNDGTHVFARTREEHERNVDKYQR